MQAELTAMRFYSAAEEIPSSPGAYLLLIELGEAVAIWRPRRGRLGPGQYLYAGSAYGPGGLKARIARHMRRNKTRRWHIDQVTGRGKVRGAWVWPMGSECAFVELCSGVPIALEGFGSTDCTRCSSHLLGPAAGLPPILAERCSHADRQASF